MSLPFHSEKATATSTHTHFLSAVAPPRADPSSRSLGDKLAAVRRIPWEEAKSSSSGVARPREGGREMSWADCKILLPTRCVVYVVSAGRGTREEKKTENAAET